MTLLPVRMSILEQLNDISTSINNEIESIRLIDHPKGEFKKCEYYQIPYQLNGWTHNPQHTACRPSQKHIPHMHKFTRFTVSCCVKLWITIQGLNYFPADVKPPLSKCFWKNTGILLTIWHLESVKHGYINYYSISLKCSRLINKSNDTWYSQNFFSYPDS